jgi:O-antigen ligase
MSCYLFARKKSFIGCGTIWMALYAIIAMFSFTYSSFPLLSLWKGFEVFSLVCLSIFVGNGIREDQDIHDIINMISLILLFLVLTALIGMLINPSVAFPKMQSRGTMAFALQGVFPSINANTLSQISGMLASLALCWILRPGPVTVKLGSLLIFLCAFTCLLLAHSRTSLFAFFINIGFLLFMFQKRLIAVIVLWLIPLVFFLGSYIKYIQDYIMRGQSIEVFSSLTGRTTFWPLVWEKISESPIFGHGFYASQRTTWNISSVDNTYLEVMLGVGLIGLLFFSLAIYSLSFNIWKTRPSKFKVGVGSIRHFLWLEIVVIFSFLFLRSLTGPSFQVLHPNLVVFVILLICSYKANKIFLQTTNQAR